VYFGHSLRFDPEFAPKRENRQAKSVLRLPPPGKTIKNWYASQNYHASQR
jgi:hypothetical protein